MLPKYKVVLQNDDVNSVEKVIAALHLIVGLPLKEAMQLVEYINDEGSASIGAWHHELAETIVVRLNNVGLTAAIDKVNQ